jgi:CheY-like chemotaxis protein
MRPYPDTPDDEPYAPLKAFLLRAGVPKHKHTSELTDLLGLAKTSVFRKLKGDSSFTLAELKVIAEHYNTDVGTLRGLPPEAAHTTASAPLLESAQLHIAGLPSKGEILVGAELAPEDICQLVAIKRHSLWEVFDHRAPELQGQIKYSIESLRIRSLPHQRIAVLEDDRNMADSVRGALEQENMVVHTYEDASVFMQAIRQRPYQGYVIDWILGGSTAQQAIETIRAQQIHAPIAITTGAMQTGAETEGQLVPFAEQVDAGIFEKPFRHKVLASYLRRGIESAASHPTLT